MIAKKLTQKKSFDNGTELAGKIKKFCRAEGIQVYTTKTENKCALLNVAWKLMETDYKQISSQFVTTLNSTKIYCIDLVPKKVEISDFLSILYSRPLRESKKPKVKNGNRVRISKYDWPDKTLSSFTFFLFEQLNPECKREVELFGKILFIIYQIVTEGKFMFLDLKKSKSSDFFKLESDLYISITLFVEATNTLIQERFNHSENCITVKFSRRTQKVEVYLANEDMVLHSIHRTWETISVVMFAGNLVRCWEEKNIRNLILFRTLSRYILSIMICTDLVKYTIVGDTNASLLRCFPFLTKLKAGDNIAIGQNMHCQTCSNLQFRPPLKNWFHFIHIDLRDTSIDKTFFVSVGFTRFLLTFEKASNIHYQTKVVTRSLLQDLEILVPATVYNNTSVNTQSDTKQELPKYQFEHNPMYQIDSHQKDVEKAVCQSTLFKWQSFVFSSYQAPKFAGFKIGWRRLWRFTIGLWSTTSS